MDKPQGFPDHPQGPILSDAQLQRLQQLTDPGPLERATAGALGPVMDRAGELLDPRPLLRFLHLYGVSGVGPGSDAQAKAEAESKASGGGLAITYEASPQMKALYRGAVEVFGIHDAGDSADVGPPPNGMPATPGRVHVPMPGAVQKNKAPF